jgi:hypothetical protein
MLGNAKAAKKYGGSFASCARFALNRGSHFRRLCRFRVDRLSVLLPRHVQFLGKRDVIS